MIKNFLVSIDIDFEELFTSDVKSDKHIICCLMEKIPIFLPFCWDKQKSNGKRKCLQVSFIIKGYCISYTARRLCNLVCTNVLQANRYLICVSYLLPPLLWAVSSFKKKLHLNWLFVSFQCRVNFNETF